MAAHPPVWHGACPACVRGRQEYGNGQSADGLWKDGGGECGVNRNSSADFTDRNPLEQNSNGFLLLFSLGERIICI